MDTDLIKAENIEFVLARLKLAQSLLEESDFLEGQAGYKFESEKWWLHPRHEREALVSYLLLTCFDRLGQEKSFTTFPDWLKSKKTKHSAERNAVLDLLKEDAPALEIASALAVEHQALYGVRNAFCRGINNLPENSKQQLFSSVRLTSNPEYGMHGPNVSTPNFPLEDKEIEQKLKLKYLYEKRNRFTHRLEQYQSSSTPLLSGSSWSVWINDSRIFYHGIHQESVSLPAGGAHIYTVADWPFTLFETLYAAVEYPFERTSIKLKFKVRFQSSAHPGILGSLDNVEHRDLKDFVSLEKKFWAQDI